MSCCTVDLHCCKFANICRASLRFDITGKSRSFGPDCLLPNLRRTGRPISITISVTLQIAYFAKFFSQIDSHVHQTNWKHVVSRHLGAANQCVLQAVSHAQIVFKTMMYTCSNCRMHAEAYHLHPAFVCCQKSSTLSAALLRCFFYCCLYACWQQLVNVIDIL